MAVAREAARGDGRRRGRRWRGRRRALHNKLSTMFLRVEHQLHAPPGVLAAQTRASHTPVAPNRWAVRLGMHHTGDISGDLIVVGIRDFLGNAGRDLKPCKGRAEWRWA